MHVLDPNCRECTIFKEQRMKRMQILSLVAFSAFALAGCATKSSSGDQSGSGQTSKMRDSAVAVLGPAPNGGNVRGTVTFREETEGVRVTASVEGLTPGQHGFHIHDKGDCSAADFTSAEGTLIRCKCRTGRRPTRNITPAISGTSKRTRRELPGTKECSIG